MGFIFYNELEQYANWCIDPIVSGRSPDHFTMGTLTNSVWPKKKKGTLTRSEIFLVVPWLYLANNGMEHLTLTLPPMAS